MSRRWGLRLDGSPRAGEAGVVIPVRAADDSPVAMKLQMPGPGTTAAIIGLRAWSGRGMVRLLDSDEDRGVMLLERLHGERSLESVADDDEATLVVGQLLARLHSVPPPAGVPRLVAVVGEMVERAATAVNELTDHEDRVRVLRWSRVVAELRHDAEERLLHWDLHFGNVLAGDRDPWLGIDPEPLVGDPGFDLWPALDSGWSQDTSFSGAADAVRRRFYLLTEVLQLDRDRAAGWTYARLMQNTLWDLEDGRTAVSPAAKLIDDVLTTTQAAFGRRSPSC
jgi:streptomycin 6-kinase